MGRDVRKRWMTRRGHRTAWIVVHENGPGKGGHGHLLLHVPAGLVAALTGKQRAILKHITGSTYRARVIHSRPVGGKLAVERTAPGLHAANLANALHYIIKGAEDDAPAVHMDLMHKL
jgi:hypothetical protein